MGNIRWSALSVSQAVDKLNVAVEPIFEHLWRADAIVKEAMQLPNLPDYMKQSLSGVLHEIHRVAGTDLQHHYSQLLNSIDRVHHDLPDGSVEAEVAATKHGKTESMV
jgi:hypothetical protein